MIDLIAVSAYDVGGSRVLVPQRVDAERPAPEPPPPKTPPSGPGGWYAEGAEDFAATIDSVMKSFALAATFVRVGRLLGL